MSDGLIKARHSLGGNVDYVKHYNALILRARLRESVGVLESHHVVPRCMGGTDGKKNRVDLTPAEHYVAHLLLVRIFPKVPGLILAAVLMSRDNRNGKRANNKLYDWLRKRAVAAQSLARTGMRHSEESRRRISAALKASSAHAANIESMRGVARSDEVKRKVSETSRNSESAKAARALLTGRKIGVPRSEETKEKIRAANTGRIVPDIERERISAGLKGKPKSAEHNAKVSAALKGRKSPMTGRTHSPETKERMRLAALARKHTAETKEKLTTFAASQTQEERSARALKAWETKRAKKAAQDT